MRVFAIIFLLFLLVNLNLKGQTRGCVVADRFYPQGRVNYSFIVPRESYSSTVSYDFRPEGYACAQNEPNMIAVSLGYASSFFGAQIDCGLNATNFNAATGGKVYNANLKMCPIDDYIPLLVIPIIFIGYLRINANRKGEKLTKFT